MIPPNEKSEDKDSESEKDDKWNVLKNTKDQEIQSTRNMNSDSGDE